MPTIVDPDRTVVSVALGLLGSVCGVAATLAAASAIGRGGRGPWLAYIGQSSLQVYLAHIIFAAGTREAAELVGFESFAVLAVCATVLGVVGPLLLAEVSARAAPWLFKVPWNLGANGRRAPVVR